MENEHFDSVGTNIANVVILYITIILLALLALIE